LWRRRLFAFGEATFESGDATDQLARGAFRVDDLAFEIAAPFRAV
jgi:hypothetical protein